MAVSAAARRLRKELPAARPWIVSGAVGYEVTMVFRCRAAPDEQLLANKRRRPLTNRDAGSARLRPRSSAERHNYSQGKRTQCVRTGIPGAYLHLERRI
jgi:hypothetical protein